MVATVVAMHISNWEALESTIHLNVIHDFTFSLGNATKQKKKRYSGQHLPYSEAVRCPQIRLLEVDPSSCSRHVKVSSSR